MEFWHSTNDHRFHKASLNATRVYSTAIQSYQAQVRKSLETCILKVVVVIEVNCSKGRPAVPSAAQLADYFHLNYLVLPLRTSLQY